ncbi:hypothetical protein [Natronorubrum halophilum]|uniref:hypothetical protein n=1 Tax=Natronorubrum halophilum TaxID=1702106 RepID=UPI000EF686B5|nr:hypothetical protein [Natronorubrum halophilum]
MTIADAARRLEADAVVDVARAAFDHAGELATLEYGHAAAVLGAVRLASRRTQSPAIDRDRLAAAFDVDPDRAVAAEKLLASHLSPPAAPEEIRSLRRRLIVAHELLAAAERGRVVGPELPGSSLADAAPILLVRATDPHGCRDDLEQRGLDQAGLRTHVERLEADLEFARLGTKLDALVNGDE